MLVADRKYRRLGIGSALVKHAEKWARQHIVGGYIIEPDTDRN
jgi:GNAT superfamily N-acetyltransferase